MSFTIAGKPPAGLQRIERNGNEVLGKEIRIIRIIFSACNKKRGGEPHGEPSLPKTKSIMTPKKKKYYYYT